MASTDATPLPKKNTAYRVTFPILDNTGALVTGAAGLDSEVSKDGGTFADCTNEATEIATSSGVYYLDLTSTEMNADTVAIIVKTSTTNAKTTTLVLYPVETGDIPVNVTAFGGTAGTFASGRPEVNMTHIAGSAVSASTAQLGVNVVNFGGSAGTFAAGRPEVNTSHIAGSAVSASSAQIGVNVVNAGGTAWGSGAITAASIAANAITSAKLATDCIGAAQIAADAIGSSELAATAVAEIADGVWDEAISGHLTAGTTGAALNGAGSAGDPWSTALPGAYSAGSAGYILGNNLNAAVGSCATASALTTVGSNVTNIQSRLPAALVSGRIDASVGAMGTGVITSASFAAGAITSSVVATGAIDADALAADAVAEILDTAVDGAVTLRQALRLLMSALAGKLSGAATTTISIRDLADTKNRIVATVDANGNRSAVTLDLT